MPSYPHSQFVDLEEMMLKQLLSLELRDQNVPPPSPSMLTRTPSYNGQPRHPAALFSSSSSLSSVSHLSADQSDSMFLASSLLGQQQPASPQTTRQRPASAQWRKPDFWAGRSLSMVETTTSGGGVAASDLGWPCGGDDVLFSQSTNPATALGAGSSLSSSSLASQFSSASSSTSSSSSRYKTELCRTFAESGTCKYGGKCQFAHGYDELRDLSRHPKYKTEPCRTFHTIGFCPYGIRCHFVHNDEEEADESSSSSPMCGPPPGTMSFPPGSFPPGSFRPRRPPLLRQSFSFAGFPSPPPPLQPTAPHAPSFSRSPSVSPTSCADITELLARALLGMDVNFEASPALQQHSQHHAASQQLICPLEPLPPRFLPSPDSGCSLLGLSPGTSPPPLRLSPGAPGAYAAGPLGARSLSHTSLNDADNDGGSGSSDSSLSSSESARRLAVFSQLSVPDDGTGFCL